MPIIDVNVNLSRWPSRRLPADDTPALVAKLKSHGVTEAWAGSLDGLLHKDIAAVNSRLASECQAVQDLRLRPVGSINPMLPDWQEDVRRCAQEHRMHAVRLHPNYHGYRLDHPSVAEFLALATEHRLIVQLPVQMEDERVMHPLLRVKPVDLAPLVERVAARKELRLMILNAGRGMLSGNVLKLVNAGQVFVDIAVMDGLAVIEEAVRDLPLDRILFGSHAPMFYFESALLKLQEAELTQVALHAIQFENAQRLR